MTPTDKFEQNQTPEALSQNDSLNAIKKEIDDLKNEEISDDKLELNGLLTSEFSKNLKPEDANMLLKSIEEVLNNKPEFKEKKPEGLDDLIKFLKPITNPLNFSGVITGLDDKGGKFWGKIEISKEGQDSEIGTMLKNIETKLSDINAINDDRLNGVKNILNQAMVVINKPGKNNTNILQKFIYENLPDNLKEQFGVENHLKDGKFDGQFGKSTLNGLKQILTIADGIISDIKEAKSVENKGDQERSKIDEDKKAAAEEAEKKAKEIKERINKIVSGLGLKKDTNGGLDRKEFGLPIEGDLYTRDGQEGYYYFDKNVDNVMFVHLNPMNDVQKLTISNYKEGVDRNEQPLEYEKLKDYPAVNEYGRQSLEITLKSRLMGTTLGNYPSSIKIDNNLYKLNSFGHLASIPKEYFIDGWLFKRNDEMPDNEKEEQIRNDSKFLNLANYLFNKFDGKTGKYEIKDNGKLVFKSNDGKEKTGIGKFDLESEYGKLNNDQVKLFCDYLNNNGNIANHNNSEGNPDDSAGDASDNKTGNSGETVATKPKDTSDGNVDNTQKIGEIVKKYGLGVVANMNSEARANYGLPETGNVYMIGSDTMYLYFVSQDGKSLVRTSGNSAEGQYILPLSKFNAQIQELGKQSWEKLEAYPAVNERGRQYYDKILQDAVKGTSFGNFPCKITIGKDNGIDRYFVKTPSTDSKKNRKGIYYIQPIMRDVFTKGWMFDGTNNKTLGKNLRMINLVNHMVDRYGGKIGGATFNLKNGGELVINEFGKETTIISRSEWSRDYGKINDAKKVADFNVYLNRVCGGMYVNTTPAEPVVTPTDKPVTPAVEPVITTDKPVTPAVEPVTPTDKPVTPAVEPVITTDKPVTPAAEPVVTPTDINSDTGGKDAVEQVETPVIPNLEIEDIKLGRIGMKSNDFKQFITEVFNLAIDRCNNADDQSILLNIREGLTNNDELKIKIAQEKLQCKKDGMVGILTMEMFLNHFKINEKNAELDKIKKEISEKNKENEKEKRKNDVNRLMDNKLNEFADNNGKDKDGKEFNDREKFQTIMQSYVDSYINGDANYKKLEDFEKKLNEEYNKMIKHYACTGLGNIEYTYYGNNLLNKKPHGYGNVKFKIGPNNCDFLGRFDKGVIRYCASQDNYFVNIDYNNGKAVLKNKKGKSLPLKLDSTYAMDIGRIASMVNLMCQKVCENNDIGNTFQGVRIGILKNRKGALVADFARNDAALKSDIMNSMYIDENAISEKEILDWFNEQFSGLITPTIKQGKKY